MFNLKKQISVDGVQTRYSITILYFIELAVSWHILKGDHLDLALGIGPIDIRFGTTIWRNWIR